MRGARLLLLIILAPTCLVAQGPGVDFGSFVQRYADDWMRFHTNAASSRRYFAGAEEDALERQIEPVTGKQRADELQLIRRGLDELARFDHTPLAPSDQRSLDIIRWDLQTQRDAAAFDDYYFPFAQNYGVDANLISLLTVNHTVRTARDAENYLARLSLVSTRMDEATTDARGLAARKRLPPRFILQTTAQQMREFLQLPPAANPFVATFADKLSGIGGMTEVQRNTMRASAERITSAEIYPAWRRALALLEREIPLATDDAGLWRFPKGSDAYSAALKRFTTTAMTADQIHEVGLKMVAEIEGRMDSVLRQLGYTEGTLRTRMDRLMADQPTFPDSADGRAQYNALITNTIRDAERRAAVLFDRVPKMPVVARAYPDFMRGRAASYSIGTVDGSRPGTYQYAVTGVTLTTFGLRTTAYHEAVPGHHFQGALQAEDTSLPRFLRDRVFGNNSAIGEGWGLYAERLAAEQGWYDGDPTGLLGQMQMALFRARRLVVDTGLHAKHWTRAQAIEYLGPLPGLSPESEVDRYVSQPGQACSYMIGELKIVELREKARSALGDRFSLAEFHNRVLGAGRVPLDVLEQDIQRWITEKRI
jgi:uncharacterized protein (DUF885 family)